jgi:hypothetical protein
MGLSCPNLDSAAKTLTTDREAERYAAISLAPLRLGLKSPPIRAPFTQTLCPQMTARR